MRAEGEITRGTTGPNRLRRVDRWIGATQREALLSEPRPLIVDLGYGASPVTTVELYRMVRRIAPDAEVTGLEIDTARVESARSYLDGLQDVPGLSFVHGGFELPVARRPVLVRAFNVLRQYSAGQVPGAWDRLRSGLADGGVLIEGTCDELGRRAVWLTLPAAAGEATITFSARLASLERPSDLAERLPKVLIHRNTPGQPVHAFLRDFDRAWASAAPYSALGRRQRWLAAVGQLTGTWPVLRRPPYGGPGRWRLGEVTLPWSALEPATVPLPAQKHPRTARILLCHLSHLRSSAPATAAAVTRAGHWTIPRERRSSRWPSHARSAGTGSPSSTVSRTPSPTGAN